jgi:predicted pyridoxine 5'-phosphate oxidase superfamily flavin-nucleotide-binding protein
MYHEGELEVQRRAGVTDEAARVGRIIGGTIPPVAARFIEARPFVIASTIDDDGRVWATALFGNVRVTDEHTLRCVGQALSLPGQAESLSYTIGILAIDLATRRRMRVNGLATRDGDDLVITTQEVYSNCPQYIHPLPARPDTSSPASWINTSDTFFLATAHPTRGADASHRGGEVHFDGKRVVFPDYRGNNMFNSLGNLAVNPNCGLLFIDFESGKTLQLTGKGRVEWEPSRRVIVEVTELRSKTP